MKNLSIQFPIVDSFIKNKPLLLFFLVLCFTFFLHFDQFLELAPSPVYIVALPLIFIISSLCISLAFFEPRKAFLLFLFTIPLFPRINDFLTIPIGTFKITLDSLILYSFSFILFQSHTSKKLKIYFTVWIFYCFLNLIIHPSEEGISIYTNAILPGIIIFYIAEVFAKDSSRYLQILKVLNMTQVISALYAIAIILNQKNSFTLIIKERWASFYYNPIIWASIILMILPLSLVLAQKSKGLLKIFYSISILLGVIGLILTGSRGALIIFIGQILIYYSYRGFQISRRTLQILVGAFLIVLTTLFIMPRPPEIFHRFSHLNFNKPGYSGYERIKAFSGGIELGSHNFMGVGLGNFSNEYRLSDNFRSGLLQLESAHSFILTIYSEIGILGVLLFLLFIYLVLIQKINYHSLSQGQFLIFLSSLSFLLYSNLFYGEFLHRSSALPYFLFMLFCGLFHAQTNEKKYS